MHILATVTKWQSLKDSCRRIAPMDGGSREIIMNPSRMSEITAISSGSRFLYTDHYNDRRDSPDLVEISQTPAVIRAAYDTPGAETLTLTVYRNNDTSKDTYDIEIPQEDLIYADRSNANPTGASWISIDKGSFKSRGAVLAAMSLEEILSTFDGRVIVSGLIIYTSGYEGGDFILKYSFDGGVIWETLVTLNPTEIAILIDAGNDYRHRIVGTAYHIDQTITALGYDGIEDTDWENIYTT